MKQALALILLVFGSFRAFANPTSGWDVDSYSSSSSLLGGYLMLGTVIFIMLFAIGGAIAELGNEKLKKMKKKKREKRLKRKIERSKSEVTKKLRTMKDSLTQTKEQNRKDAVIAIQRERLREFSKDSKW